MNEKLHNHIAGKACQTDAPGKPADVTELIAKAQAVLDDAKAYYAANDIEVTDHGIVPELLAALAEQTARAEAAGALVRDLLEGYGASYIDSETWEKVTTEAKAFLALAAQEGGE